MNEQKATGTEIWSSFTDGVAQIFDTSGQLIGSVGINAEAAAINAQALANYNANVVELQQEANAIEAAEREKQNQKNLIIIVSSLILILAFVGFLATRKK